MNKLLYKTITADTQVSTQECYFVGVQSTSTGNTSMVIYDEADNSKTACRIISTIRNTTSTRGNSMIFPSGGVHCEGIYVDWNSGTGTIWYYY